MKKGRQEAKHETASHLDDAEKQIINFWSDQATYLQSSRNAMAVAARLALGEGPHTIEQLSNDLGIARSSLTNAVREGMAKGFIKSVRVMGKRKEYFAGRSTDPIDGVKEVVRRMMATFVLPAIDLYEGLLENSAKLAPQRRQMLQDINQAFHYEAALLQGFLDADSESIKRVGGSHKANHAKKKRSL